MLACTANETLVNARTQFLEQVKLIWPDFLPPQPSEDVLRALRALLGEKKVLSVTGAFVRKVFDVFNAVELVWPEAYVVQDPVPPVVV